MAPGATSAWCTARMDFRPQEAGRNAVAQAISRCFQLTRTAPPDTYQYYSVQDGGQCFCGNSFGNHGGKAPENECNMPCHGNASEPCGGYEHNTIYNRSVPTIAYKCIIDKGCEQCDPSDPQATSLAKCNATCVH